MTAAAPEQTELHPNRPPLSLLIVAAVCALALIAFVVPRYRKYMSTVDQNHRWAGNEAPPPREIVWQPAEIVQIKGARESQSHIRPHLIDRGAFLYFTIRDGKKNLDIVRSKRDGNGWSKPQRVAALNSSADDVGPVISADGKSLYLYSNRDGGIGGMDLYVSTRDGDGWSEPKNLGPAVNSPAHEFDPAISPDGRRLYFASNRTTETFDADANRWTTTLRSDLGQRTFDLFVATGDSKGWQNASPLAHLNTPNHNEGSPYVSPDGAFLWFASDRPNSRGQKTNFDLYRSRINGPDKRIENLGNGVNTSANEMDPSLSLAGFQLNFSRSGEEQGTEYSLYQSTAKEIYHEAQWESSNFWSYVGIIGSVVKRFLDRFWLLLLLLAAIASLIWLIRQIRFRHVAVPGFLILALALHLLLVAGSFFVFFQQAIADRLRRMMEEEVVATQVLTSTVSKSTEQSTLESVADLKMPDPIEPAKVSRQAIEYSEPKPIELAEPIPIAGDASLSADDPAERVVATIPIKNVTPEKRDPLQRAAAQLERPSEQVKLLDTVAVQSPQLEQVQMDQPAMDRKQVEPSREIIKPAEVQTAAMEAIVENDSSQLDPAARQDAAIEISPTVIPLDRAAEKTAAESERVDTVAPTEKIASVESEKIATPSAQVAELPRSQQLTAPTLSQPEPMKLLRQTESDSSPLGADSLIPLVATEEIGGSVAAESIESPLQRAAKPMGRAADAEADVATESIKRVASQQVLPTTPTGQTIVETKRQESVPDVLHVDPLAVTAKNDNALTASPSEAFTPAPLMSAAQVSRDPLAADALVRRPARSRLYADASVRLQNLLMRRKLDEATKQAVVKEFGGNDETLEAVRRGLVWMAQHQHRDGYWSINEFHKNCEGHKDCDGRGSSQSKTAGTALALLPFLGDGNTHTEGPYKDLVAKGITWLIKNQKKDGNLFTGGERNAFMYSHGIATIALCECYGMTGDQSLRGPAQRAIDFIVAAQDVKSGGWRYQPRSGADTSVVGWQVMALKSGQMAELNVPEKTLKDAQRWIDSVAGTKNRVGQFAYQRNHNFNPAMTAEAILCLEYLDTQRESDALVQGTAYMLKNLPKKGRETSYYWYYGTQSMFHLQGEPWKRWNDSIHPLLVNSQHKKGPMAGTWDPKDQWENSGGRIYATSLRVLMLEVYYRHLPLYQVIE